VPQRGRCEETTAHAAHWGGIHSAKVVLWDHFPKHTKESFRFATSSDLQYVHDSNVDGAQWWPRAAIIKQRSSAWYDPALCSEWSEKHKLAQADVKSPTFGPFERYLTLICAMSKCWDCGNWMITTCLASHHASRWNHWDLNVSVQSAFCNAQMTLRAVHRMLGCEFSLYDPAMRQFEETRRRR
jgi:hypothetical protein